MTAREAADEVTRLSAALAEAIESGALDLAESLVDGRARVLKSALPPAAPITAEDRAAWERAAAAIRAADERSRAALGRIIPALRKELAWLANGAAAMRAYVPMDPVGAGYIDRRD